MGVRVNHTTSLFSLYSSLAGTTTTGMSCVGLQINVCALLALGRTRADLGMQFVWLLLLLSPPAPCLLFNLLCLPPVDPLPLLLRRAGLVMKIGSVLSFNMIGCFCSSGLTILAL